MEWLNLEGTGDKKKLMPRTALNFENKKSTFACHCVLQGPSRAPEGANFADS
jgi:hypothetical protein